MNAPGKLSYLSDMSWVLCGPALGTCKAALVLKNYEQRKDAVRRGDVRGSPLSVKDIKPGRKGAGPSEDVHKAKF